MSANSVPIEPTLEKMENATQWVNFAKNITNTMDIAHNATMDIDLLKEQENAKLEV